MDQLPLGSRGPKSFKPNMIGHMIHCLRNHAGFLSSKAEPPKPEPTKPTLPLPKSKPASKPKPAKTASQEATKVPTWSTL